MTEINNPDLLAAKEAITAGRKDEARRLLQRYTRQNPADYRPWLWLAGLADSPSQSLAYLQRAETIQPDQPAIQKAKQWAEQKLAEERSISAATTGPSRDRRPPLPANAPQRSRPDSPPTALKTPAGSAATAPRTKRSWLIPAAGFIMLAFVCGVILALFSRGALPLPVQAAGNENSEPVVESPPTSVEVVADVSQAEATQDAILPLQSPTPTATNTPLPTPTLQPTNTPVPTETPVPTVMVFPSGSEIPQVVNVAQNERWINVDLATQTLTAYEGATPVFNTLISSGTANHPTVTGQYRIWLRYESQTMNGRLLGYDYYLEDVPYVMYFFNDYALHGTYWHNNFGTPMSHGCVNLATMDAEWLFNWSSYGTLVNVHS